MLKDLKIGFCITGSFCCFSKIIPVIKDLNEKCESVLPIMSTVSYTTDTRFGKSQDFIDEIEQITGRKILHKITEVEPIGPKNMVDIMVVAPCTGNSLAKLKNAITDTPVIMAVKSHLRNNKPVIIAVSTNDGLSNSAKNIGELLNTPNIYFVPFGQDDHIKKPRSLVAHFDKIIDTIELANEGKQIQPILV